MIKLKSEELKDLKYLMSEPYERDESGSTAQSPNSHLDTDELGSTADIEKSIARSEKAFWSSVDILDKYVFYALGSSLVRNCVRICLKRS